LFSGGFRITVLSTYSEVHYFRGAIQKRHQRSSGGIKRQQTHAELQKYFVEEGCRLAIFCSNSNLFAVIQVEDPLGEAMKYLKLLQDHSADSLETHLLAFEVFFRKQKHLLALQVHYMISKGRNLGNFSRRIGHGWLFPALTYSMLVILAKMEVAWGLVKPCLHIVFIWIFFTGEIIGMLLSQIWLAGCEKAVAIGLIIP
jgi:hypothetical protein